METTLYEVEFNNGSKFRVFCANKTQKRKFRNSINKLKHYKPYVHEVSNGIHNMNQWQDIVKTL